MPVANSDAVNKTYLDSNFYFNTTTLNAIEQPTANVSLNSFKITNLADPTVGTDALNRDAADARYYLQTTTLDLIAVPTSALDCNAQRLTNLADPTNPQDSATKVYVDDLVSGALDQAEADARYYLNTVPLNQITLATADLDVNNYKLTNLADPTSNQDGATKLYVD